MTAFDRDDLIRLALRPADDVHAPADLAFDIAERVARTPQRRSWLPRPVARWVLAPSPAVVLAAVVALLLLVGVLIVAGWLRPAGPELSVYRGGPDRTGVMPGPGPVGAPTIAWQGDLQGAIPVQIMPLVHDGLVLVADEAGFLSAFDAADGGVRWMVDVGAPVRSSPLIVGDVVVVGAGDGSLTAYDLATRSVRWRVVPGDAINASLLAVDGFVYAGSDDGTLYVVDAETGVLVRSLPIGGVVSRGPAISNGTVFIGSAAGTFMAIDAATGNRRWEHPFTGETGTPSVAGGTVFVPWGLESDLPPGGVTALATVDGRERWTFDSPSGAQVYVAAIGDGLLFVVSKDGFVYALDAASGEQRWAHDTGDPIGALAGLVDGVLYTTNDGRAVQALTAATGELRWSILVAGTPSMPAVIDGRLFVATMVGKVVAIAGSGAP